jgi:RNA polymerase primary sigma factor
MRKNTQTEQAVATNHQVLLGSGRRPDGLVMATLSYGHGTSSVSGDGSRPPFCRSASSGAQRLSRPRPAGDHEAEPFCGLTLYMREIGQVRLLSRDEEAALARRVQQGDPAAREKMIKANLRLVVKIAHDFESYGLPLLDLISEGNIGLMTAVERYNPAKGAKLSVYASFYIKQRIRRAISDQARTIRVPIYTQTKLQAINAVASRLQELLGHDPTDEEIADEAGLPVARVRRMRRAVQTPLSLDQTGHDRESQSVAETVADQSAIAPDEALASATVAELLQQSMRGLSEREKLILRCRFALDGEDEQTLDELSRQMGLTRERVRQIQNGALQKLRRQIELRDALLIAV